LNEIGIARVIQGWEMMLFKYNTGNEDDGEEYVRDVHMEGKTAINKETE
jgi:hypothetical protein